jgi:hypothetical protein
MIGAQASSEQMEKILSYSTSAAGRRGMLTGGQRTELGGELRGGYYIQPTVFRATTRCAVPGRNLRAGAGGDHLQGRRTRWPSPTTRFTVWARACGAAI